MEMEQIMTRMQAEIKAKIRNDQEEITPMLYNKMGVNQEKMEARIDANSKKFETIQSTLSTLVSQMDIHYARREAV
jgi:hypothetical protein